MSKIQVIFYYFLRGDSYSRTQIFRITGVTIYFGPIKNNQICLFKLITWLILYKNDSKWLLYQFMLIQHLDI